MNLLQCEKTSTAVLYYTRFDLRKSSIQLDCIRLSTFVVSHMTFNNTPLFAPRTTRRKFKILFINNRKT